MLVYRLKAKPFPSDGLYFKRRLQRVKYLSQIADLYVDDLGARVEMVSPDLSENRWPAHHLSFVEKEECQEPGGRGLKGQASLIEA